MSSFYERKLKSYFKSFFDVDNDDYITYKDFEILLERYKTGNNIPDGDPRIEGVLAGFKDLFNLFLKVADYNNDGKVSFDEFLRYWKESAVKIRNGATFKDLGLQSWIDFAFKCFDVDSDGVFTDKDYLIFIKSISTVWNEEKAKDAWNRLVKIGRPIDANEYAKIKLVFFSSENEDDPENYLIGPINNF